MAEEKTDRIVMVPFKKGQIVFEEGTTDTCMYKIMSGAVALFKGYSSPKEMFIKEVDKGDCFGEMAILESSPRSATAICQQDSLLMIIPQDSFFNFITQNPKNALDIMKSLSNNLRSTTSRLEESYSTLIDITLNKREPEPRMLTLLERYASFNPQTNKYEFTAR